MCKSVCTHTPCSKHAVMYVVKYFCLPGGMIVSVRREPARGATVLQKMLYLRSSMARVFARPSRPSLAALQLAWPKFPQMPAAEVVMMILATDKQSQQVSDRHIYADKDTKINLKNGVFSWMHEYTEEYAVFSMLLVTTSKSLNRYTHLLYLNIILRYQYFTRLLPVSATL